MTAFLHILREVFFAGVFLAGFLLTVLGAGVLIAGTALGVCRTLQRHYFRSHRHG